MIGKIRYTSGIYTNDLLKPDLILKIDLPPNSTIPLSKFLKIEELLKVPSRVMEQTYDKIKGDILMEMQAHKEPNDPHSLKIRYQHSIQAFSNPFNI